MSTQLQKRRGTTAEHNSFTGAEGELTIDTTKDTAVVHDGVTTGGQPLAREDLDNVASSDVVSKLASQTLNNITFTGTTTVAGLTTSDNVVFGDNDKAIFGAGSDLQIYHDGSNSWLTDQGQGDMYITTLGNAIYFSKHGTENLMSLNVDGDVKLYYDNALKLATTSTGIDVTGTVTADGLTVDMTSGYARIQDLNSEVVDGTDMGGIEWRTADTNVSGANRITATINVEGDGTFNATDKAPSRLVFSTHDTSGVSPVERMRIASNGDISFYEDTGTTAKFFWDASAESLGIGTSSPQGRLDLGSYGSDSQLSWHNSATASYGHIGCQNSSAALCVMQGLKTGATSNTFESSVSTAWAKSAMMLNYGAIQFFTDPADTVAYGTVYTPSERMRIDSSGNLLVGTTTSSGFTTSSSIVGTKIPQNGVFASNASGAGAGFFNRLASDGEIVRFSKNGTAVGSIGAYGGNLLIGGGDTGLTFEDSGKRIQPWDINSSSHSDDIIDLGYINKRFDDIYATNGTIQTSDEREKQDIDVLSDAEHNVAVAAKGLLRKFRWKNAVAEKGDDARIHFGVIAQDLKAAFEAEGLDAGRYAMFIHTEWWEAEETYTDDDGVEQTRTDTYDTEAEAPEGAIKKDRMGVRYPELLAFIIAAI